VVARKRTVRVGIIRCDTHGFWYAPFFEEGDPKLFHEVRRGIHYYAYRWYDPDRQILPAIPGMVIARVWHDEGRKPAEAMSKAYRGRPIVCDSFEEVSDDVDLVFLADCNYEAEDHVRLAAPGLKKGVPHFIDKPFAYTLKDAHKIIALAKKHKTAVMTASLLRHSPHLKRFRSRLKDIAPVTRLLVPSYGSSLAGFYHALSVCQAVLGERCDWVESMGTELFGVVRLHFPGPAGGTDAIIFNAIGKAPKLKLTAAKYAHCAYHVSAFGAGGAAHNPPVNDYAFIAAGPIVVRLAKQMALTGKPPIPYDSMLQTTRMIEAARLAHNKGRRVYLKNIR